MRSLEGQMTDFREEMINMFVRWGQGPSTQLKGKHVTGHDEALPLETPKVSPKFVISATILCPQ